MTQSKMRRKEGQKDQKTQMEQIEKKKKQNDILKPILSNCIKCKWAKHSNKKYCQTI